MQKKKKKTLNHGKKTHNKRFCIKKLGIHRLIIPLYIYKLSFGAFGLMCQYKKNK